MQNGTHSFLAGTSTDRRAPPTASVAFIMAVLLLCISASAAAGSVAADGAFTCDFKLPADVLLDPVGALIERDRIYMARRPGMLHKHIPLRPDPLSGTLTAGGRYLFDTFENAKAYKLWVENDFILDGVHFLQRPDFLNPDCHAWSTIGAHDFADIHDSQIVLRTERWLVPRENQRMLLVSRWPAIRAAAGARGLTSVWLLYNRQEQLVSLVYFADRTLPLGLEITELAALVALELAPPLGSAFNDQRWTKTLDRTQWVVNIWFPNPLPVGDHGEPSLWPNSPLLPQPSSTDGVCVPSRGESHSTAPNDCSPDCGNDVWDPDEDNQRCPSDVPAF